MLSSRGSICGILTSDLPLGCLQCGVLTNISRFQAMAVSTGGAGALLGNHTPRARGQFIYLSISMHYLFISLSIPLIVFTFLFIPSMCLFIPSIHLIFTVLIYALARAPPHHYTRTRDYRVLFENCRDGSRLSLHSQRDSFPVAFTLLPPSSPGN